MNTKEFYKILDTELTEIINNNQNDDFIRRFNGSINNQKAYAFLIWFLNFYGNKAHYIPFITEGENDSSCDIIFDFEHDTGKKVFYIVQSKWKSENNCTGTIESKDIKYTLNDFDLILRENSIESKNKKLQLKFKELREHINKNGEVRFIFLALCKNNPCVQQNIDSFLRANRRTYFDVIDIEKLKRDYIERRYKEVTPINPLFSSKNPEEVKIEINIERIGQPDGNYIHINKPHESYLFLIRPKELFQLFEEFGFSLFHKNVRNPLLVSKYNKEIEKTISEDPAYFWYFNNGITAISYTLPVIRKEATKIELTGLQIINGAQTVYSIYSAFKNASQTKREIMNQEALVSLRLLKSGGKNFDLKVTRYTNSQNPVTDRDFYANDDIQVHLQNESFDTNFWYEKRRDEFRKLPKGVYRVSNYFFAASYLASFLEHPTAVINAMKRRVEIKRDLLFTSHKDDPDGLYEKIFNENTEFKNMLASFYLLDLAIEYLGEGNPEDIEEGNTFHTICLFKYIYKKYLKQKGINVINFSDHIIQKYEKRKIDDLLGCLAATNAKTYELLKIESASNPNYYNYLNNRSHFDQIKEKVQKSRIKPEIFEYHINNMKTVKKKREKEMIKKED